MSSYEIKDHRQFVWIFDAWQGGVSNWVAVVRGRIIEFLSVTFKTIFPLIALGLALYIPFLFVRKERLSFSVNSKRIFQVIGVLFFWYFVFLFAIGYYQPRLSFNFFVLLLVAVAVLVHEINQAQVHRRLKLFVNSLLFSFVFFYKKFEFANITIVNCFFDRINNIYIGSCNYNC